MKKILILAVGIALVGAACNKVADSNPSPAPTPTPTPVVTPAPAEPLVYRYAPYNFEFEYTPDFQFTSPSYASLDEKIVQIELPQGFYPGTNFGDAAFSVSIQAAKTQAACLAANAPGSGSGFKTSQVINGVTYYTTTDSEPAAGNLYESKLYRTFRNNICFELQETLHTSNIANYPAGTVKEVNKDAAWAKLDGILNSFKFN